MLGSILFRLGKSTFVTFRSRCGSLDNLQRYSIERLKLSHRDPGGSFSAVPCGYCSFCRIYGYLKHAWNQHRWFSVKTTPPPHRKAMNLLLAKARTLKKGHDSDRQGSSDHYFAAGAAKKRSHLTSNPQQREHAPSHERSTIELPTKPLNSEEWDKLKGDFNGKASFEDWVISQMVRSSSSVDAAKSLLAWVAAKNNGIVGYNLLVKYLYLCVSHKQTSEVIDVYEIMKAKYKCLETAANTILIRGLIHSDRWREALLLLEDIKKVMVPSKRNYNDCIQGALLHQDVDVAWSLYQELVGHNLIPLLETLKAFFDFGKDINDDDYSDKLLDILLYLRNNQLYPGESFAHSIKTWFESIPGRQWKGQFTTVQRSGHCSSCGRALESIHLSPEEYEFLKGKIMRDVIDGGDQYKKTTPQELKRFENFVNSCPPFDIVIDGLNVAKMFPKSRESQMLTENWLKWLRQRENLSHNLRELWADISTACFRVCSLLRAVMERRLVGNAAESVLIATA
ncbi:Mitochondrial ribonuclease P protein 3 [Microtus ochrogaster]|uniref:ribonuclease P n=1 Tax=Microtus ochrogaster TaxID=79684 RepID=A0A8J6GWE1_MICOH|nr:Mitochondrial ribonuclease P protein 3 [Microtus ochrogaster]